MARSGHSRVPSHFNFFRPSKLSQVPPLFHQPALPRCQAAARASRLCGIMREYELLFSLNLSGESQDSRFTDARLRTTQRMWAMSIRVTPHKRFASVTQNACALSWTSFPSPALRARRNSKMTTSQQIRQPFATPALVSGSETRMSLNAMAGRK